MDNFPAARKPYEKPEIKQVPLRPEEAVLGSCKNNIAIGPGGGGCHSPSPCFTPGS